MRYKFSVKEIGQMLDRVVVIIDTREKENTHVIDYFKKNNIAYKVQKLDYGDYSCYLPIGSFEGQEREIYFDRDIAIERKFCIDELAMNLKDKKTNINEVKKEIIDLLGEKYLEKVLKSDYVRIKHEFANMNRYNIEFYIFIEDKNFDQNIHEGKFRADYKPDTLYARLKGLEAEFHTRIRPVSKEYIGKEIYNTMRMGVRNRLVHEGFIEIVKGA